jgi:hypothetical protein
MLPVVSFTIELSVIGLSFCENEWDAKAIMINAVSSSFLIEKI